MSWRGAGRMLNPRFWRFLAGRARRRFRSAARLYTLQRRHPAAQIGLRVEVTSPERIVLGERAVIHPGVVLNGGGQAWCDGEGGIEIGDDCFVGAYAVLWGTGGRIHIGDRSGIGQGVQIYGSTQLPRSGEAPESFRLGDVEIGEDVIVYSNSVIGTGVRIGNGASVGAGSVVLHDVPPGAFVAGVPARRIGPPAAAGPVSNA